MRIKLKHLLVAGLISLICAFSSTSKACSVDFGSMNITTEDLSTCIFYDTTSSSGQEVTKANSDSHNNESTAYASGLDHSTEGNGSGLTVVEGVDSRLSPSLDVNPVNSLSQE